MAKIEVALPRTQDPNMGLEGTACSLSSVLGVLRASQYSVLGPSGCPSLLGVPWEGPFPFRGPDSSGLSSDMERCPAGSSAPQGSQCGEEVRTHSQRVPALCPDCLGPAIPTPLQAPLLRGESGVPWDMQWGEHLQGHSLGVGWAALSRPTLPLAKSVCKHTA